MSSQIPLFETHTLATMERAKSTFVGRGAEYGDTWRECRFLKMAATAKALGYDIKPEHLRALATAGFCDMKYWRFLGGFKDDSLVDGINYDAFLAEEMQRLTATTPELPGLTLSPAGSPTPTLTCSRCGTGPTACTC